MRIGSTHRGRGGAVGQADVVFSCYRGGWNGVLSFIALFFAESFFTRKVGPSCNVLDELHHPVGSRRPVLFRWLPVHPRRISFPLDDWGGGDLHSDRRFWRNVWLSYPKISQLPHAARVQTMVAKGSPPRSSHHRLHVLHHFFDAVSPWDLTLPSRETTTSIIQSSSPPGRRYFFATDFLPHPKVVI